MGHSRESSAKPYMDRQIQNIANKYVLAEQEKMLPNVAILQNTKEDK